ncbi:MAG TPA: hypothetical protein PLI34_15495, partial [Saprospiraceae bacterium]|nr:hypothetical protein [Saprospiraceae bacterium]
MKIKDKILKFNEWCTENEIALFKGDVSNSKRIITLKWYNDDLDLFLKFLEKVNPDVLGYNEVEFDLKNEIEQIRCDKKENEQKEEIIEKFKKIKKYEGSPVAFSILLVKEGALYEYVEVAEFADEYFELTELIEEYLSSEESEIEGSPSLADIEYQERGKKLAPFAKQLAEDEEFQSASYDTQLQGIVIKRLFGADFYSKLGYDVKKNRMHEYALDYTLCKLARKYYDEN